MEKLNGDLKILEAGGALPYCLKELRKHLGSAIEGKTQEAFLVAALAHEGQYRKGSGYDYIIHPTHVACIMAKYTNPEPEVIQAALLHDTLEDTDLTYGEIVDRFGGEVADLVVELTTPPEIKKIKRSERTAVEAVRLSNISSVGQDLKRCDMYSNVRGMYDADPAWAPKYALEKFRMHKSMGRGNDIIYLMLSGMFINFGIKLDN